MIRTRVRERVGGGWSPTLPPCLGEAFRTGRVPSGRGFSFFVLLASRVQGEGWSPTPPTLPPLSQQPRPQGHPTLTQAAVPVSHVGGAPFALVGVALPDTERRTNNSLRRQDHDTDS